MEQANSPLFLRAVGRKLAETRARRGLTQAELAERVEVSLKYLQRIEAGRHDLRLTLLSELAHVLHVHPGELLRKPRSMAVRRGRPEKKRTASSSARGRA